MNREFWKNENRKQYQDGMEFSRQAWKEENEVVKNLYTLAQKRFS
jgi:hypothetical protein